MGRAGLAAGPVLPPAAQSPSPSLASHAYPPRPHPPHRHPRLQPHYPYPSGPHTDQSGSDSYNDAYYHHSHPHRRYDDYDYYYDGDEYADDYMGDMAAALSLETLFPIISGTMPLLPSLPPPKMAPGTSTQAVLKREMARQEALSPQAWHGRWAFGVGVPVSLAYPLAAGPGPRALPLLNLVRLVWQALSPPSGPTAGGGGGGAGGAGPRAPRELAHLRGPSSDLWVRYGPEAAARGAVGFGSGARGARGGGGGGGGWLGGGRGGGGGGGGRGNLLRNLGVLWGQPFAPDGPAPVQIAAFDPTLIVMRSKQLPRRLVIIGSDGRRYMYLLKGHEDLRQDERVMQLFRLVNSLLRQDPVSTLRSHQIQPYAVIPMSEASGILEWVPACTTIQRLVTDYRNRVGISVFRERERFETLLQGVQDMAWEPYMLHAFLECVSGTAGNDLRDALWLNAKSAEDWFSYRRRFTRSLAVMSIVGYMLGLGDRHLANLLIQRKAGTVVHIDFGDCFEVAMHRAQLPERVPFRLTRMILRALGPAGAEGTFVLASQRVLQVLRAQKPTLLALLEAFVFDPLLSWGLRALSRREPAAPTAPAPAPPAPAPESAPASDPAPRSVGTGGTDAGPAVVASSQSIQSPIPTLSGQFAWREAPGAQSQPADFGSDLSTHPPMRRHSADLLDSDTDEDSGTGSTRSDGPDPVQRPHDEQQPTESFRDASARVERQLFRELGPLPRLNRRAIEVVARINDKLSGLDFANTTPFTVAEQVEYLIYQATAVENLCTAYVGYHAFW